MEFEWDEKKNKANIRRHGISFELASIIFNDFVISRWDKRSYGGEEREISYGRIRGERIIVVVHIDRGEKIRIISARKANKKERKIYYDNYYKKR